MEFTQQNLAEHIGVDRATIIAYEKDTANIPSKTIARLAELFDVDCSCLVHNRDPQSLSYQVEDATPELTPARDMRISIPQNNVLKFKEVLLYILNRVGARPHVGQTVVYKLLYFIDFDYYELFEEQLMGATYIKNSYGPTPVDFAKLTKQMEKAGDVQTVETSFHDKKQRRFLPGREANLNLFSARELHHIDACLARYGEMNATQISEYSHKDIPWITTQDRQPINYESVFYRNELTARRYYLDDWFYYHSFFW